MKNLTATAPSADLAITYCDDRHLPSLRNLLARYNMQTCEVAKDQPIPGSHFGDPEAGLIGNQLYVRHDTPLHSALHESCHYVCMDDGRRSELHTDAGGDYDEENAVCYLSIILSDYLDGFDRNIMMRDMDQWGYSFRLGSAWQWFHEDAEDARQHLMRRNILLKNGQPSWQLGGHDG